MSIATDSAQQPTIAVTNPATGEVIGEVPAGGEAEARAAVAAATAAFDGWRRTPAAERAELLKAAARRLRDRAAEIARTQTLENGRPLRESVGGVEEAIAKIEQYAELGALHRGYTLAGDWDATDMAVREPYGVVAVLVPWNDPIAIAGGQIAAALVTGNTVVFKPSERTPLSAIEFAKAFELPDGVFNLLHGDGRAGAPLVADPRVDLVMHTGSVITGREIARVCAERGARYLLELGGKDPLIVDRDVDPEWAADQAAGGAFANAGQICTSVERIYVHRDVADEFAAALAAKAESLRIGSGLDDATQMGPLIDERQLELVERHVREALDSGAQARTGARRLAGEGCFYAPTVLVGARPEMAIMREETFGPIAAIQAVGSFDEAIAAANATEYGLAATVLTASQANAQRAWRELEVGTVKVNSAWGGAPGAGAHPRRASGVGIGYGPALLDEMTRVKVVHVEPARERPRSD